MKIRKEINGLFRTSKKILEKFSDDSQSDSAVQNQYEMSRVTDELGNEYLCPTGSLKNENFVSEDEKTGCFDYATISRNRAEQP